jgi:hypothetical protein
VTASAFARRLLDKARLSFAHRESSEPPNFNASSLPEGAKSRLRFDHPRLIELKRRYLSFDSRVTRPLVWTQDCVRPQDLLYFRGENAYVWQLRGLNMDAAGYALATYYVKSIDKLGLLENLGEDGKFGTIVFEIAGKAVSRDLLDSILEIYFLDRHLGLASAGGRWAILDIGAGYGRLAHRLLGAVSGAKRYLCTDAVAESTFISEYYLGFRGLQDRALVVPLDEIEAALDAEPVDLAINVHSFSECQPSAIDWWISILARHQVRYLMIVPNQLEHGGTLLLTNQRDDMRAIFERHGYRELAKDPKYGDALVQKYAINPTSHFLFELR